jgi:excinuclease UvrABC nuclease subunit
MMQGALWSDERRTLALSEIESAPNNPAVFIIWPREGEPYLGRTGLLKRRLLRLLRERDKPSRLLNLRDVTDHVDFWPVGSQLESSLLFYGLARQHFPDTYSKLVKLRMPAYVKVTLANEFPRTAVTTRVTGGKGLYYGPFRTRVAAEHFDSQFLDLFQIRRCEENLEPRADHPGCIYGEMNMCLRPCQMVVSATQYSNEVARVEQFLTTGGTSLLETIGHQRQRFSEELDFEEAARQHKRYERVQQILGLRDELVSDVDQLCGVAVAPAADYGKMNLWFVRRGFWHGPFEFPLSQQGDQIVSMDSRLRHLVARVPAKDPSGTGVRQEHLALLARWFYSTWRDGEWVPCASLEELPFRKIVNAIGRVAKPRQG